MQGFCASAKKKATIKGDKPTLKLCMCAKGTSKHRRLSKAAIHSLPWIALTMSWGSFEMLPLIPEVGPPWSCEVWPPPTRGPYLPPALEVCLRPTHGPFSAIDDLRIPHLSILHQRWLEACPHLNNPRAEKNAPQLHLHLYLGFVCHCAMEGVLAMHCQGH